MNAHLDETKTILVSGLSASLVEIIADAGFERLVSFSIQSAIGVLTFVYLIIKIINALKRKEK